MKSISSIILLLIVSSFSKAQSVHWSPEQCLKLKNISSVRVSPAGNKVLYTVREAMMTDDRSEFINQVWMVNSDGSNAIQFSQGDKNSSNPKWHPDGKSFAFISSRDGKSNLYQVPIAGGESMKLTDVKASISEFEWSHSGRSIAFTMTDIAEDKEEKNKKAKDDWYYMDEKPKQSRLYVLTLSEKDSSGKYPVKLLTKENYNIGSFDWSPDDKNIVFGFGKSSEVNDMVYGDIAQINVSNQEIKNIASAQTGESDPIYSPDGKYIVYYSNSEIHDWSGPEHAHIYNIVDGKHWALKLTPNTDGNIIGWSADSKSIFWSESNKTLTSIYQIGLDGNTIKEWTPGIKDFLSLPAINSTGSSIGFLLQNSAKMPEAYISSTTSFNPIKITNLNAANSSKPLPKTEVVKWKSKDGKEIEGLLTYPIGYQSGKKVPFILNVHGGPAGVFTQTCVAANGGVYPIAALAEEGYAILRPNPRGSTGYGADFRMANRADWGGKDYEDLMTGVDHVINMGVADENKMAVMGWSYGGFMSSWIVGHTNRFKVASIGAPVVDLAHQNLTDDIEGFLPSYFKSNPWDNWSLYDQHSPLRYVQNVSTPVMLQHGEADQRVPFSNAVMYYNALRRRGVPVKLLALPRQPHGPTEPRMVLKTMQSNVEWIGQYIGVKGKS